MSAGGSVCEAIATLRQSLTDLDRAVAAKLRAAEAIDAPPELRDLVESALAYADAQAAYAEAYARWSRERPEEINQSIDAPGWKEIAEAPCRAASRARDRMCKLAEELARQVRK